MAARQKLPYWCKLSNKNSPQILLSNSRSMFILNLDYCDFFIWSPAISTDYPNYLKIYVEKNDAFINDMSVKLQNYFLKVLLPEVVTRKNDICTVLSQWLLVMLNTVILSSIITHVWTLKLLQQDLGFVRIALQRIRKNNKKTKWLNLIVEVTFSKNSNKISNI